MLISEMEDVLKSLDQRVGHIEEILPTLATKAELRDETRGVKVLVESVRDEVKVVHDRIDIEVAGLNRRMDDVVGQLQSSFAEVKVRLDEVITRLPRR